MKQRKLFNELLERPQALVLPGAYDALSAKIMEKLGFEAIFTTGYGISASLLAKPDWGLLTFTEMLDRARQITSAVDIPVFGDADTGYGNPVNVVRTVQEFERAGLVGIFIEDQEWPKRCGHMEGKKVISEEEMVQKIKAATEARVDPDFKIMARLDDRAIYGLEEAIKRAKACVKAGADMIFIEAPQTVEELKEIPKYFDVPLMANMIEKGKTPYLTVKELEKIGYKVVTYPLTALYASTKAIFEVMKELKEKGSAAGALEQLIAFNQFNELIGLKEMQKLQDKYTNK
jgi:carboxyvinyl-carboxyphosphonate phosphorylmutase